MANNPNEPTQFPMLSQDTFGPSGPPPSYSRQHETYRKYLSKAREAFTDITPIAVREQMPSGPYNINRPSLYAVDIGEFTEASRSYTVRGQGPMDDKNNAEEFLTSAPAGTRLRMLFCLHHRSHTDAASLHTIASFYDVNPRFLQEYRLRYSFMNFDITDLPIKDTCPEYLPSEAHFSPILFDRAIYTRPKKMMMFLASNPSQSFKTVLIMITKNSDLGFYPTNVVNRDIMNPTIYLPSESYNKWRQPQNEAETCFLRLSRQSSIELEACVSQPILTILPLIRGYCLETSQDIWQIRDHINYFGLGDASLDKSLMAKQSPESRWGHEKMNPFQAFQKVNGGFTKTYRSLRDHLSSPWLDRTKPHMEIADVAISIAMGDVQRVQEEVIELREILKETSALVSAQESIYEARRSVAQAESVNQLTRLAFIFIPLTFATSVFGMNIGEWQDNVPHLKWFFVVALCCTGFSIVSAIALTRLSPPFKAWTAAHHGFLPALWHFFRDNFIRALLFVFIHIPTQIRDFQNPELRRIRREQRKQAKELKKKKKAKADMV
ncbi:hypothetical protein TWF192_003662 [Orbilia oligospora]|uniref:Uncharacterized protein n=1 Tax=Orbilia oligospora TaxID=2813651 RepID=A0A6G1LS58_ORBOL|nr:hypothetical protein TWF191_001447 [Orbilia oligospora]KAF3231219.1 hypothetical protein TWF192_003662 [Orbilia oligospora]